MNTQTTNLVSRDIINEQCVSVFFVLIEYSWPTIFSIACPLPYIPHPRWVLYWEGYWKRFRLWNLARRLADSCLYSWRCFLEVVGLCQVMLEHVIDPIGWIVLVKNMCAKYPPKKSTSSVCRVYWGFAPLPPYAQNPWPPINFASPLTSKTLKGT